MKRNLSQLLQTPPEGGHSKESFDLHNAEYFHQKGAQLNVASIRSVAPNCDYEISIDSLTRTLLCNTANFADIKENWYILFVPNALVCNNAYQMLVQRRQDYSAIRSNIEQFPVFDLKAVVRRCIYIAVHSDMGLIDPLTASDWYDIHGFCIAQGALRLLDMLKYGCYLDLYEWISSAKGDAEEWPNRLDAVMAYLDTRLDGIYPSVQAIGAYQCAWYNYFRNSIYDVAGDASCYNFDDVVLHADGVTPAFEVTAVRGVDAFIQKCLKLHYVQNKRDMFMGSMPGTQFGACASVPLASNLSFVVDAVTGSAAGRYSGNYAYDSENPINTALQYYDSGHNIATGSYSESGVVDHNHTLNATFNIASGPKLFDVLTLVSSQAMQKWRQKSMLAGNKTVDQFRAHHGEVPRHLVDHLPDFIGSVDNMINVSEITSTANTLDASEGANNLGEIRGRGYGVSDRRTFKFHSSDYGTVILLHSIVTENVYSSFGLAYDNRLIYYSDFFQQEFQNIGLEAVPKFLLDTLSRDAFGPITDPHPDATLSQFLQGQMVNLYGMYAKYFGYKEYFDQVHGLFNPSRVEVNDDLGGKLDRFGYADMQSFVVPRSDMVAKLTYQWNSEDNKYEIVDGFNLFNLSRIYQNPRLFDSIFGVLADDHFDSDQFFTKVRFNVDSLLPMTKLGLPDF